MVHNGVGIGFFTFSIMFGCSNMDDNLSTNFKRSEFACKGEACCGHSAPISNDLIVALEAYRRSMGAKPITINSGFRCLTHNRLVGSQDTSQHTKGNACDISSKWHDIDEMAIQAKHFFNKVIKYKSFIHVDVRKQKGGIK